MNILRCKLYLHPGTACIIGWHIPESIYLVAIPLVGVLWPSHCGFGATESKVVVFNRRIWGCSIDLGRTT